MHGVSLLESGDQGHFVDELLRQAQALGLSDAAQNHAGGRRLDALFID